MLCKNPFIKGDLAVYPCGQCLPCRINRRRLWTHRILLEAIKHEKSCFITLTYAKEHYPTDGSLNKKHLQLYFKRLREAIKPEKIRYYAVGEYGDVSGRAHYHVALFGIGEDSAQVIQANWLYGFSYTGSLTLESSQYIAGYVTKKMTSKDDPRLEGRTPEFAVMSNRPGIGALAVKDISDFLTTPNGAHLLVTTKDVPLSLAHSGKSMPLGRYLRRKIREELDIPQSVAPTTPQALQSQAEMQALLSGSQTSSRISRLTHYKAVTRSKIRSIETKFKIHSTKGKIL